MPWLYPTPQVNPLGHRSVEVLGDLPPGVTAKVFAVYRTTSSGLGCVKRGFFIEGIDKPLETTIDGRTERVGSAFKASVSVDRYLPGRCGWTFSDLWVDLSSVKAVPSRVHIGMNDGYWSRAITGRDSNGPIRIDRSKLASETVVSESASATGLKFVGAPHGSEYIQAGYNLGYDFLPQRIYADTTTIRFRVAAARDASHRAPT